MSTDVIIAAARAASAPDFGSKNADNLAALSALLEAAEMIAQAIYDNATDDREPISTETATQLQFKSWKITRMVVEASQVSEEMPQV